MNKRVFDIVFVLCGALILVLPAIFIGLAVKLTSRGPSLFWSERVGRNSKTFRMPKFRTMYVGSPVVATAKLNKPELYLTPIGSFLRKNSLDEIPQLWSILVGHMSVVGPRPALQSQDALIAYRCEYGVDRIKPGLTGLAQIRGRDNLSDSKKSRLEKFYLGKMSICFDLFIILNTIKYLFNYSEISH